MRILPHNHIHLNVTPCLSFPIWKIDLLVPSLWGCGKDGSLISIFGIRPFLPPSLMSTGYWGNDGPGPPAAYFGAQGGWMAFGVLRAMLLLLGGGSAV